MWVITELSTMCKDVLQTVNLKLPALGLRVNSTLCVPPVSLLCLCKAQICMPQYCIHSQACSADRMFKRINGYACELPLLA